MCTVSLIRIDSGGGYSLMFNRDEQRSRARAAPPMIAASDTLFGESRLCSYPIDPVSGGTWIGANVNGLAACLLNSSHSARATLELSQVKSRGEIVPRMLACTSVATAVPLALSLNPAHYPAFRLILVDISQIAVIRSDTAAIRVENISHDTRPLMWGSSGLGDELVEPRRLALFLEAVPHVSDARVAQATFHAHQWPDATHLSVQMSREEARTVSRTRVEFAATGLRLEYEDIDEAGRSSIRAPALWLPLTTSGDNS